MRIDRVYLLIIKRFLDIFLSFFALILLSPVFLICSVLVRVKLGSPVFFKQERPGKGEKSFYLYKFRSMTNEFDENGMLLPDEVRLTKFGKMLRNTSLDELPELINILRGDMSIVGPRPLLTRYLPYYTETEHHRHDIRPGLTGLAQVKGRNFITWEEIFQYDLDYVGNVSFLLDVKIVWWTILKVISHSDISDATQGTVDSSGRIVHDSLDIERKNNEK